mmetsp:Transcript_24580/g.70142  ORF Transcript_24580/g.70142 Transcript_24580/m.70142 type:complete len:414 (-) Transcript_24580:57-1298(-)
MRARPSGLRGARGRPSGLQSLSRPRGESSRLELVTQAQPRAVAGAVRQLRPPELVRHPHRVFRVPLRVLTEARAHRRGVLCPGALPERPGGVEARVGAVLVDADGGVRGVHGAGGRDVREAARVGDVVAAGAILLREADIGDAAGERGRVGALDAQRGDVARGEERAPAAGEGRLEADGVPGAGDIVVAHLVGHVVAHLQRAQLLARAQAALDALLRRARLRADVHARDGHAVARHGEVVLLVAVELQLHVAQEVHGALLHGVPSQLLHVVALAADAQGHVLAIDAGVPGLGLVALDAQRGVPVELRGVAQAQPGAAPPDAHGEAALLEADGGELRHFRPQALDDLTELALHRILQRRRLALPIALHGVGGAGAAARHGVPRHGADAREDREACGRAPGLLRRRPDGHGARWG